MDVDVGGDTHDELDQRKQHSPALFHLTHTPSPMHPSSPPTFSPHAHFSPPLHRIFLILW